MSAAYIIGLSCRYCGCTDSTPCLIPEEMQQTVGSDTCAWLGRNLNVCNAPACLEKHYRDLVRFIEPAILKARDRDAMNALHSLGMDAAAEGLI